VDWRSGGFNNIGAEDLNHYIPQQAEEEPDIKLSRANRLQTRLAKNVANKIKNAIGKKGKPLTPAQRAAKQKEDEEAKKKAEREKEQKRAAEVCNFMSNALSKLVTKKTSKLSENTISTQNTTDLNRKDSVNLSESMNKIPLNMKLRPITQG
jgi:hypothetical protein